MRTQSDIKEVTDAILQFRNERDWEKFHNGKDLAVCLTVEAAELLELFLWKESEETNTEKLREELADVFYTAFLIADKYGFDVKQIILEKLEKNGIKYPINKSKGSNKKYDEL